MTNNYENNPLDHLFEGNIYLFHAFDVGDDINIEKVKSIRCGGSTTFNTF